MTARRIAGGIVLTAASMITPAQAQGITGGFLYERCQYKTAEKPEPHDAWICASYIRGAVDGVRTQAVLATGSFEAHTKAMPFCIPPRTDMDATIDVVVRHIAATPASRDQVGALAVSEALAAAWPCQR